MKRLSIVVLAGLFSLSLASNVLAEEQKGNAFTGFLKKLFHVPVKTTEQVAGVTANVAENTGEKVIAATGENTAQIVTGDIAKTGELVAEPVVGTAETAGQAVAETVEMPVNVATADPDAPLTEAAPAATTAS